MKRSPVRFLLLTLLASAFASPALAFNQVNVTAPAINCVFSTTCSGPANDVNTPIFGGGFVQSRVHPGEAGTQAAGKWIYEYRIDMTHASTILNVPYVNKIEFLYNGGIPALDYNGDGLYTDYAFVITFGGLGTIAPSSNGYFFGWVYFNFASPVWAGDSSYFWGMASNYPPHVVNATISTSNGQMTVQVWAPNP